MANYGQPESFSFMRTIATETPPAGPVVQPGNILQVGDTLKLRTYFEWSGTNAWERGSVSAALAGTPTVTYYFEDLEAGGTPIQVPGGAITKLALLTPQAMADLGIATYDFAMKDLYVSADTAAIATGLFGSGQTLSLPSAAANQGSWQVTVVLNGGLAQKVSAFSSDMLIQVLR